jgi:hypothetical protein
MAQLDVRFMLAACMVGACGSSQGATDAPSTPAVVDTCPYLQADNCYTAMVAQARTCLGSVPQGMLSADRMVCDYGGGKRTELSEPAPRLDLNGHYWNLTVKLDETACATAAEGKATDVDFVFTTALGTYTQWVTDETLHVACPDGSSFEMPYVSVRDCVAAIPRVQGALGPDGAAVWATARTVAERARLLDCTNP